MRARERRSAALAVSSMTPAAPLYPLVDLHLHALYGVDSGPASLSEAVELCVQSAYCGVAYAVLTPHFRGKPYAERIARLAPRLLRLREALIERGVPLELALAGECRFDAALHQAILSGELPWLGRWENEKVLLIEFGDSRIPAQFRPALDWMRARGIRPMLAHPERIREVQSDPARLREMVDAGLLLQVDADAVAGGRGPFAQEAALQLLRNGWVTVLASNAHDLVRQPPRMQPGRLAAAEVVGEAASWQLVAQRPAAIAAAHFPMLAAQ